MERVLFSDDLYFMLRLDYGHVLIYYELGTRNNPHYSWGSPQNAGCVMVWARISTGDHIHRS